MQCPIGKVPAEGGAACFGQGAGLDCAFSQIFDARSEHTTLQEIKSQMTVLLEWTTRQAMSQDWLGTQLKQQAQHMSATMTAIQDLQAQVNSFRTEIAEKLGGAKPLTLQDPLSEYVKSRRGDYPAVSPLRPLQILLEDAQSLANRTDGLQMPTEGYHLKYAALERDTVEMRDSPPPEKQSAVASPPPEKQSAVAAPLFPLFGSDQCHLGLKPRDRMAYDEVQACKAQKSFRTSCANDGGTVDDFEAEVAKLLTTILSADTENCMDAIRCAWPEV